MRRRLSVLGFKYAFDVTDRLAASSPAISTFDSKLWFRWVGVFLLVAISIGVVFQSWAWYYTHVNWLPSQAITRACNLTLPGAVHELALDFPNALVAREHDRVHITLNMTLHRMCAALYGATTISKIKDRLDRCSSCAYDDCVTWFSMH